MHVILTFLAAAQQKTGQLDDAFESIEQALSVNPGDRRAARGTQDRGELLLFEGRARPAEAVPRLSVADRGMGSERRSYDNDEPRAIAR